MTRHARSNRLLPAAVILVTLFAGYVAAGPFLTMKNIQEGLAGKNTRILEQNIDFDSLRVSIKSQINAQMGKTADNTLGGADNPMAHLAKMFLSQAVDKIVDHSLTPEGLTSLIKGKPRQPDENSTRTPTAEPHQPADSPSPTDQKPDSDKLSVLDNADMSYDSLSQSSFWITNSKGQQTRLVFTRHGVRWKLSDIILPASVSSAD